MKRSSDRSLSDRTARQRALIRSLIEKSTWAAAGNSEAATITDTHNHALKLLTGEPEQDFAPPVDNVIPFPNLRRNQQEG